MVDSLKKLLTTKDQKEIEDLAKNLSLEEIATLLQHIEKGEFQEGIFPLIQGLPAPHFVYYANAPLFLKLANTTAVQKKLQALVEYFNSIYNSYKEEELMLDECINELPLFPIPSNIFNSLCDQIVNLSDKTETVLQHLDQILKVVWLSEKSELVEDFSQLKNIFLNLKQREINQPMVLFQRINSIFGSDNNASSLDGLSALGINYVEDLKHLHTAFSDNLPILSEKSLVPAIHDRLIAAGLATIGDLRKHQIYTKEHLYDYLNKG